jgi:hypothetical protein
MDNFAIEEFEEFEGLQGAGFEENDDEEDNLEDDPTFRPVNVSTLQIADVMYEMERRSMKTSGFQDTDREALQKVFDDEFQKNLESAKALRREQKRRAAQQAGMMKRRMIMEKTIQEEQDELAKNHQIGMMIGIIKDNLVGEMVRLDVNSVTARALAKVMWVNTSITYLDLSNNDLNDHAGSYIARILSRNKTLKKIELDNNKLGPKTASTFGECLQINTTLTSLSLDSNPLCTIHDSSGIKGLANALSTNNSLVSLNLWRTGITAEVGSILASAIESNNKILFCDVGHNMINMCDIKKITDKLDDNVAQFEVRERLRRANILTEEEKLLKKQAEDNEIRKQKELAIWLDDRRNERAAVRRQHEEERAAEAAAIEAENRRIAEQQAEAARKAKEEADAKKAKKAAKAKK